MVLITVAVPFDIGTSQPAHSFGKCLTLIKFRTFREVISLRCRSQYLHLCEWLRPPASSCMWEPGCLGTERASGIETSRVCDLPSLNDYQYTIESRVRRIVIPVALVWLVRYTDSPLKYSIRYMRAVSPEVSVISPAFIGDVGIRSSAMVLASRTHHQDHIEPGKTKSAYETCPQI